MQLTANFKRAARFLGVGGMATLAYWVALLFLLKIAHLNPTRASVIAYLCGIVLSFAGHRFFTYKSSAKLRPELARFLATYAVCFCVGNLVFWIASAVLKWPALVAGALLTACNIVLSYAAAEVWIFAGPARREKSASAPQPPRGKPTP